MIKKNTVYRKKYRIIKVHKFQSSFFWKNTNQWSDLVTQSDINNNFQKNFQMYPLAPV
jgi:hypothetical protein